MNIFEQFGIKEVANCTLFSIELDDNDEEVYVPVLYLDTLKVSTVEKTASQVSARGGLGNAELVTWDFGKEINLTLEDALYTPASQGMMWAGKYGTKHIKLNGTLTDLRTGEPTNAVLEVESFNDFKQQSNMYIWNGAKYKVIGDNYSRCRIENGNLCYNYKKETWGVNITGSQTGALSQDKSISNGIYTFRIDDDKNLKLQSPYETIYQIDHSVNNVYYVDKVEKVKASQTFVINTDANLKHSNYRYLPQYDQTELVVFIDPKTMEPYEPNTDTYTRKDGSIITGNLRVIKQYDIYYKFTRTKAPEGTTLGGQIIVDAAHFPGAFKLVGETYARSRNTQKDQRFQFEVPLCKMSSDTNLTLQADGDPTTFSMNLKVLRREDGVMMKLTQYRVEDMKYDGKYVSGSTKIVPQSEII